MLCNRFAIDFFTVHTKILVTTLGHKTTAADCPNKNKWEEGEEWEREKGEWRE